jgi:hypothetical protein
VKRWDSLQPGITGPQAFLTGARSPLKCLTLSAQYVIAGTKAGELLVWPRAFQGEVCKYSCVCCCVYVYACAFQEMQ